MKYIKAIVFYILALVGFIGFLTAFRTNLTLDQNLCGFGMMFAWAFISFYKLENIKKYIGYNINKQL